MNHYKSNSSYAIMQPYFLPYIGYFSLIKETKKWIIFDETQYKKQSWGNRNRILKHPDGWTWIKIPIKKHSRHALYSEIEIRNTDDWKNKMVRQFELYRQKAPYYKVVINLLKDILEPEFKLLVDLNISSTKKICEYLGIEFDYLKYSELNLNIKGVEKPGDWPLEICKRMKINSYINPYFGYFMFNQNDWDREGIELKFLMNKNIPYNQSRNIFEEKLSIIDVIMWNSVEETHNLLDFDLYSKNTMSKIFSKNAIE